MGVGLLVRSQEGCSVGFFRVKGLTEGSILYPS